METRRSSRDGGRLGAQSQAGRRNSLQGSPLSSQPIYARRNSFAPGQTSPRSYDVHAGGGGGGVGGYSNNFGPSRLASRRRSISTLTPIDSTKQGQATATQGFYGHPYAPSPEGPVFRRSSSGGGGSSTMSASVGHTSRGLPGHIGPIGGPVYTGPSQEEFNLVAIQAHINSAAAAAQHVQNIALAVAQHTSFHRLAPPGSHLGLMEPPPSPGQVKYFDQTMFDTQSRLFKPTYGQPNAGHGHGQGHGGRLDPDQETALIDQQLFAWSQAKKKARSGSFSGSGQPTSPQGPAMNSNSPRRSLPRVVYTGSSVLQQPDWMAEYEAAYAAQLSAIAGGIYQREHDRFILQLTRDHPNRQDLLPTQSSHGMPALEAQATQLAQTRTAAVVAQARARARASSAQTIHAIQGLAIASQRETGVPAANGLNGIDQQWHRSPNAQTSPMQNVVSSLAPISNYSHDHLQQLVPGSKMAVEDATKEEHRDQLLSHAHNLYAHDAQNPNLLPLLHTLHKLHPGHLPTLLLLACVYFTRGNHNSSLYYSHHILSIDPNYVEAMSNIGTTLRSLGSNQEAESWWYRALQIRPGYWDAVENLIGVLCVGGGAGESTPSTSHSETIPALGKPRYEEALKLCEYVEANVVGLMPTQIDGSVRFIWPENIPKSQAARLQNLYYAKGNLRYALGDIAGAKSEYERAIEIVFGGLTLVEVLLGLTVTACNGQCQNQLLQEITAKVASQGYANVWREVRQHASDIISSIGQDGLPVLLLLPDQTSRLSSVLFKSTNGTLPGLISLRENLQAGASQPPAILQANQTSSTILLTLAKLYQDSLASSQANRFASSLLLQGLVPSTSMLLPLYYLSLALHPSPSTCNNLGILLSTLPHSTQILLATGTSQVFNGQALALQYYTYGLQLDQRHPHLYTNLGSLLKDMGHLNEAVKMYEKAVECNPKFDVALANLGNAIKDMGRVQDSIQWYLQAVALNPGFAEAVCGLVNALNGVCDWRDRGGADDKALVVDALGQLTSTDQLQSTNSTKPRFGWMGKVLDTVDKQLGEGASYGRGLLQTSEASSKWLQIVGSSLSGTEFWSEQAKMIWTKQFEAWRLLAQTSDRDKKNEGSFIVRMVERLMRRIQRKWYVAAYGKFKWASKSELPIDSGAIQQVACHYLRPTLPGSLSIPAVPTVLPFHTFTLPLTAREIRLISHRNALRISHITLAQSWVPPHVYPPPPPPPKGGKVNIGYVSSDFNNHPLSHLMQSVFGFHDLERFNVFLYATTTGDGSQYRSKLEKEAQHFVDVSTLSVQDTVARIIADQVHVLINLNGYTKGAKNEIFAVRPCPVQISFMGFAGTLGAGWCDYIVADPVVCPPSMVSPEVYRERRKRLQEDGGSAEDPKSGGDGRPCLGEFEGDLDPEEADDTWVYTEKFIYMPHSYFVNDHKQGFRDEVAEAAAHPQETLTNHLNNQQKPEQSEVPLTRLPGIESNPELDWVEEEDKRWKMRQELFPTLPEDYIIFANFNQLYKIDPIIFKIWLRILERIPKSILWLLRFPAAGEAHLRRTTEDWSSPEVASRVVFTDVAPKHIHIHRGRVADLFLDTPECNAHTTAADILWSGTPILTFPKYLHKMCSRVAASIAKATGFGDEMIVQSEEEYEEKAVSWSQTHSYRWVKNSDLPKTARSPIVDSSMIDKVHRISQGPLIDLRRRLFLSREGSRLFDTKRWVRNLEKGYIEAWERWVDGQEFEDLAGSVESMVATTGSIWVEDDDDGMADDAYTM